MKKISEKLYEFDPQIYPRKLWVSIGVQFDDLKDEFEGLSPIEEDTDAQVDITRRLKPEINGGFLVRFVDLSTMQKFGVITHEATHVATEIFAYVGAYHDPKNQEPFAYLCGWVAKCMCLAREEFCKNVEKKEDDI